MLLDAQITAFTRTSFLKCEAFSPLFYIIAFYNIFDFSDCLSVTHLSFSDVMASDVPKLQVSKCLWKSSQPGALLRRYPHHQECP